MLKTALSAALVLAATQPLALAQHILPQDTNDERTDMQMSIADGSDLRHGLTGPVSSSSDQALISGARIPIIVMMQAAKDEAIPGLSDARTNATPETARIQALRERVLLDAFGGNGVVRARHAELSFPESGEIEEDARFNRPILTRSYAATPGFTMMANAREISLLRATDGVMAVYEDRPEPPLLQDSTVLVGADDVWAQSVEGTGYAIAVLDSGVENEHPMTGSAITASA